MKEDVGLCGVTLGTSCIDLLTAFCWVPPGDGPPTVSFKGPYQIRVGFLEPLLDLAPPDVSFLKDPVASD